MEGEMVKVLFCSCEHDYQDKKYGKGKRVHNWGTSKNNKLGGWVCTVCNAVKSK
jgi:hypothetical protein